MDEIMLNCYLKYKKDQSVPLWKKITKNRTLLAASIIMVLAILSAGAATVISMIETKRDWAWIPVIIEMILCIILYIMTEQYEIRSSSENLEKHISSCRKLEEWLRNYHISSDEKILLLHKRLTERINLIELDCKEKRERGDKWLQTLMIPVMLSIIPAIIANQTDISDIIATIVPVIIVFFVLYCFFNINTKFKEFLGKRRLEKIKYFAKDLQNILDLHYLEDEEEKISVDQFVLVRPAERYAEEISAYRQEFLEANSSMDGCGSLRRIADPSEWIADTERKSKKETCPKELVPATQFLYIRKSDERLIGMIQIRHELNDYLEKYAGHIGYAIRPSERKKGYAKRMLKDALLYCKEIGLDKVMISCVNTNQASRRTILANGGKYESTVFEPKRKVKLEKYWVDLSQPAGEDKT